LIYSCDRLCCRSHKHRRIPWISESAREGRTTGKGIDHRGSTRHRNGVHRHYYGPYILGNARNIDDYTNGINRKLRNILKLRKRSRRSNRSTRDSRGPEGIVKRSYRYTTLIRGQIEITHLASSDQGI
jgi:hypothetical protein